MKAVMITMTGREESADETVKQFNAIGIEVERFVQGPERVAKPDNNRWNSKRALQACLDAKEDCLFIEDDLSIKPDRLLRGIEASITYFYLNEDESRVSAWYRGTDLEVMREITRIRNFRGALLRGYETWEDRLKDFQLTEGLRTPITKNYLYGTQCVGIPLEYLADLIEYCDYTYTYGSPRITQRNVYALDGTLLKFVDKFDTPVTVYLPHAVQHRQVRIRRMGSRLNAYSASYHVPSDLDDPNFVPPGLPEEKVSVKSHAEEAPPESNETKEAKPKRKRRTSKKTKDFEAPETTEVTEAPPNGLVGTVSIGGK